MASLEGRVVLVTGAGSGLGQAEADIMSARGADIIVHDRDAEGAEQTAEMVRANGRVAHLFINDILDLDGFRAGVKAAEAALGHIDGLVNNAGISGERLAIEDIDEAHFDRMLDINIKGAFFATQAVIGGMKERKWGRIVNTSSIFGLAGNRNASHYSAAKAGLLGLTKGWAREFGAWNITVNAIAPGTILTPMTDRPENLPIREARLPSIPLGRDGVPNDIAWPVAWLMSDEAAYITGQVLSPNGGLTIT
ncbi:MAG: SDR family NAD(P)-dependent oxidoreductase [Alphaproteobacteria bacterium]